MRKLCLLHQLSLILAALVPLAVSAEHAPVIAEKYAAIKQSQSSVAATYEAVKRAGSTPNAKRAAAKRVRSSVDGASRGRILSSSCSSHGQCSTTEYCDTGNSCWNCVWCSWANDAIDTNCPSNCAGASYSNSCSAHSQCDSSSEYCDTNGECYDCSWCVALNDSIDGSCPSHCGNSSSTFHGCSSHSECTSTATDDYYCDTSHQCWTCPWCTWTNDAIDGMCPSQCTSSQGQGTNFFGTQTCAVHTDCSAGEYCDSASTCWACNFCDFMNDAIDGTCPSQCAASNAQLGVCRAHDECPGVYRYCDSHLRCDSCALCVAMNDAYNGHCPSYCNVYGSSPRVATSAVVLTLLGVSALF